MLLKEVEEKNRELEILQNRTPQDVQGDDVYTFKALIETRQIYLCIQQRKMEE